MPVLRTATAVLGPVFGSTTRWTREVLAVDAAVRAPVPLCRRLGFVQLAVGSGTSTVAGGVIDVLAGRRGGRVLAVDASPSPYGLLARVTAGCPRLDLRTGRPGGVAADAWSAAVGPVARHYDVVATDWGLRRPALDLAPALTRSHAVCLAVRAEEGAVRAAAALLAGRAGWPPVVVALVAVRRGGSPARLARRLPAPVVPIGYDRRGGSGPRARAGCLRLAAELMRAAAPAGAGWPA